MNAALKLKGNKMTTILGIRLHNRNSSSTRFQEILTKFGCAIKTRIGLHSAENGVCSPHGIILVEVIDDAQAIELEKALLCIENIEIQRMVFN